MRCHLLVSEWMLRRLKLISVLSLLTAALADRANTLWSTARPVLIGGRRELDQMEIIGFEESR